MLSPTISSMFTRYSRCRTRNPAGEQIIAELHLRDMGDFARDLAESLDPVAALLARLVLASRHRHPCHAEQETRVDAVVASPYAFAGEHASVRPFSRCIPA